MEDSDDSDYIPEESEDSDNNSKPKRNSKSIVESENSFDSNSDHNFTPNGAGRDKKKKSSSQNKSATATVVYQCNFCEKQTDAKGKLKRHFTNCSNSIRRLRKKPKNNVTTDAIFRCEYCPFETSTLKKLLSHKESHSQLVAAGLIECSHCNFTFFTVDECTKHMNDSMALGDPKKKPIVCLKCQRQAHSQLQLLVHRALDHVKPGSPFACLKRDCDFKASQKDELKMHLMDAHKLGESQFQPLTLIDAHSEGRQAPFTCSNCFFETKNEVYLKAHRLHSHARSSEAPFPCPWSECRAYLPHKRAAMRHLMASHGLDIKNDSAVPFDQGCDPDGPLVSCRDCGHKSRTELHMLVHRTLHHPKRSQKRLACPLPKCFFNTNQKKHLKRHLKFVHKLGEENFWDYGVDGPEEQSESDEAEDVVEGVDENLDEVSIVDYDYEGKCVSTGPNKRSYKCGLCVFTTTRKRPILMHQIRFHHKRQCDICKKIVWGKYQWFLHNFSVHNRQKGNELYQWYLRCELCSYEGTTKNSYKHGATHELPRVTFVTLYGNVASGYVTFHYAEHEDEPKGEEINEDCVAPSAVKVVDITMSDEEEDVAKTLQLLGTEEETITIKFADDSDAEAETQSNCDDPKVYNPPNHDDEHLIKKSKLLTCKKCSFKTRDATLLKLHGMQMHGVGETGHTQRFRCPEDDCPFQSEYTNNLMCHLKKMHSKYNRSLWRKAHSTSKWSIKRNPKRKEEAGSVRAPDEKRTTGKNASTNPETDLDRHQDSKRKTQKMRSLSDEKHSQEPPNWRLKCSHCPFETSLKKAAQRHSARHYRLLIVTFHKYANNQRCGVLRYRYPNRNLQGSIRCHNGGSRPADCMARKAKKHVGTRLVRNKTVARNATKRGDNPDLGPSKYMNKMEKDVISVRKRKKNFVDADTYSDGDQEEIGIESPKNCSDEVKHSIIDSDWICALENDILNDDNEIIRIEVTEDADAEAVTSRIKCKNKGCDYVCHDTDDIQKHAESCAKSLSRRDQSSGEFVCSLCETTLPNNETLQNHVLFKHVIGRTTKCNRKKKKTVKPRRTRVKTSGGKVSFKCSMCDTTLVYAPSLRNHTYVHARDENNFDLKIVFSKYEDGTLVDTIEIKADPTYVPRSSSNVPLYQVQTARDIRVRGPELEYDPELPVFACAECNFKTNKEPELTRHKNLHWSEEKAAAFDAKKWFTCGVCYFHCLNAASFKKHSDKHKTRPDTKVDVTKMGKDSWFF